jgi:hypothetical protein
MAERSVPGAPLSKQDVTVVASVAVGAIKAKIEATHAASGLRCDLWIADRTMPVMTRSPQMMDAAPNHLVLAAG